MKIVFLVDRQPHPLNGNSFYAAGTRADLRYGSELVALGVAREDKPAPAPFVVEQREEIASEPAPPMVEDKPKPTPRRTRRKKAGTNAN